MRYAAVILLGYLLGSSNMAYFISRFRGVDLRTHGSGNLGASNATAILGWYVGVGVAIHDIAKAALAVWLANRLFPGTAAIGVTAGVSAVIGHIFPFYLKFRGGKGFASYLGMVMVLNWKLALGVILLALVVTVVTDYIALGTISTVVAVPAYLGLLQRSWIPAVILTAAAVIIVYKHQDNFPRILNGTEIGLRSTIRGENKVSQ